MFVFKREHEDLIRKFKALQRERDFLNDLVPIKDRAISEGADLYYEKVSECEFFKQEICRLNGLIDELEKEKRKLKEDLEELQDDFENFANING